VLLVGAGETLEQALAAALARHRVYVEVASKDTVADAVVAAAPDLILLAGEAAKDCGGEVLSRLAASPMSSVVPIAILEDDPALDARLRAFRHGAAAVIPRSASIDAIADQVAQLAREIPERGGESLGVVGEATLQEFVSALGKELRSGILSVSTGEGGEKEAVRLVLGHGRPLAEFIDDFVKRVQKHVVHAEPLRYEFDERAGGTVQLLGGEEPESERGVSDVRDLRLLLADGDSARADNVAQELRTHGAAVAVTDLDAADARFARLRQVDPAILLIGELDLQGKGYELVRRLRRDTRLRWASLLVVRWDEVWAESSAVPAISRLAGTIAALAEPERALRARAEALEAFDTRLEIVGPARCLRALSACSHAQRVSVFNPRVKVDVDLSNGIVVGATGHTLAEPPVLLEGPAALAALLVLSTGRVHVEPVEQPATTNIMATIDVALNLADAEPLPIPPSLPSPAMSMPPPRLPAMDAPPGLSSLAGSPSGAEPDQRRAFRRARERTAWIAAIGALVLVLLLGAVAAALLLRPPRSAEPAASAARKVEPAPSAKAPVAKAAVAKAAVAKPPAPPASAERPSAEAAEASAASKGAETESAAVDPANDPPTSKTALGKGKTGCEVLGDAPAAEKNLGAGADELRNARRDLVRGDLDAAHRSYCRAVALDAESAQAMTGLARLLLMRRDARPAVFWARRAAQKNPGDGNIQSVLGDALALAGDDAGARKAWLAGAGITSPADPGVRGLARRDLRFAIRAFDRRDYAKAERLFRRAVVLEPNDADAALRLARTLLVLGENKQAVAWARRATSLAPRSSKAHLVHGDALAAVGDTKTAAAEWRLAQKFDPGSADASSRLKKSGKR
jgi:tetratricopeptide (TPR) repeat protein/DNA-binding response OmpR family regulator